ncbi:MAG: LysM peptidoglycan-binding domain-containing protein, partial [Clostridia bacterium]|nr:LysM peptidoglycan-binding domain-containing protein [Clostridia bacterium]
LNGLTEDITCGDVLLIEKVEGKEYTVQPKDTLLSICGGDERKIIALTAKNRVDEVFVGQKIYI